MNTYTSKYKPGEVVIHDGKKRMIEFVSFSRYINTPLYEFRNDDSGEFDYVNEDDLSPIPTWPAVGDTVWFTYISEIHKGTVTYSDSTRVDTKSKTSGKSVHYIKEVFRTAEECRAAIPIKE